MGGQQELPHYILHVEIILGMIMNGFYLLGFDHDNDHYDNIYADTDHYFSKDREMRDEYYKWTKQIINTIHNHPCVQFIWVNYRGDNFPKLPNLFSKDEKELCQN